MPQHCELHVTGHGVMLQVPPGTRVRVNERDVDGLIALRPGDTVAFGRVQARLASVDVSVPSLHHAAGRGDSANDDPGATTVRAVLPKYVLRGVSGKLFGRTFPVVGMLTVGRGPECTLRLDEDGVSRQHARLVPTEEGVQVEDTGSTNGCFVNGRRIAQPTIARPGDEIGFDTLRLRLIAPGQGDAAVPLATAAALPRRSISIWLWLAVIAAALAIVWVIGLR